MYGNDPNSFNAAGSGSGSGFASTFETYKIPSELMSENEDMYRHVLNQQDGPTFRNGVSATRGGHTSPERKMEMMILKR